MMKRYMHGELAPDAPKRPNDPHEVKNSKTRDQNIADPKTWLPN